MDPALDALARGDNLIAHDLARAALDRHPDDARIAHTVVLALARSGATRRAEEEYDRLGLASASVDPALRSDLWALHARLAKDRALETTGEDRARWAAIASQRYATAATGADGGYVEVNAATMAALAGDMDRARHFALRALASADKGVNENSPERTDQSSLYWLEATRAEALCVLGDIGAATASLATADSLAGDNLGAKAATRRQLFLLAAIGLAEASLAEGLTMPGVVAFGGHRMPEDPEMEGRLTDRMEQLIEKNRIGIAYGSLACGADILWAEALLASGAEVHVVLPFDTDEFIQTSVRPGGDGWIDRHHSALEAACTVTVSTRGPSLGDAALYGYAASLFQGRTVVRARALTVTPRFMVVWNGSEADGPAGTGADVRQWRRSGHPLDVIDAEGVTLGRDGGRLPEHQREIRAALFGDFQGFSRLTDADTPAFVDRCLAAIAHVLDASGQEVLFRNSWGDGIYIVCKSAPVAAELAFAIQEAVGKDFGLPSPLRLRLGGHLGPMLRLHDPIQQQDTWWGQAVVTAARIEPRTPEGEIYVTEAFAALLSLQAGRAFTAEYVGPVATAKGYGTMPMYVLKPRSGSGIRSASQPGSQSR